ncbi:MAG: hypothetical protein AAF431_01145 [Pseudomonadota bacterium]
MKLSISAFFIVLFSLASGKSFAAWTGYYPVDQVYSHVSGNVYIRLNPGTAHSNPGGCGNAYWLAVPAAQANNKDILQMALTAKGAGLTLQLGVDGCEGNYPKVLHSMIE